MTMTEVIIDGLKELIIELEEYQEDAECAVRELKGTALTDEIYCFEQVSLTLGNAIEILKEIRRKYYAASKISNEDLG